MLKNEKRRDQIFEIENCEKFNIEIIRNVERFCRRIYATYSTWFIIFDRDITRIKMTKFYHYNIKCATKTEEIRRQYSHYEKILKRWENKRVDVRHQITSRWRRNNKINETIFKRVQESREINATSNFIKKKTDRSRYENNCWIHRFQF